MKKILYFMHVPWGWIKQRPHFIAEYLSRYYDINVFYKKPYKKNNLVQNEFLDNIKIKELFRLPFERYKSISTYNAIITKFQIKKIIDEFDLIWFTHPNLFEPIKDILPKKIKVIYDCMDDSVEFLHIKLNTYFRKRVLNNEEELFKRSNIIITSSNYLKGKLIKRYKKNNKIYVINNGIDLNGGKDFCNNFRLSLPIEDKLKKGTVKLTYIGTISNWLDIDILLKSLEQFKEITYMLFGPSEIKIPKHDRLLFFGPLEHKYIFNIMKRSDVLIMPFKINELILSVDPVKLYEYIFSGKPSIAIEYNETLKFKDYIYLYKDSKSYFKLLDHLINGNLPPKKNLKECYTFVLNNSWEKRINDIRKLID